MADKKISALTASTTPLAGTEVLPIVQGGNTVKVSVENLTAGRSVKANEGLFNTSTAIGAAKVSVFQPSLFISGDGVAIQDGAALLGGYYVSFLDQNGAKIGNISRNSATSIALGVGAGGGIDFSANTHAAGMTSELLDWYEEGTWTPSVGGDATYTARTGYYTRIGRYVSVTLDIEINVLGTGSANTISGLPFAVGVVGSAQSPYFANLAQNMIVVSAVGSGSTLVLTGQSTAQASMGYAVNVLGNGTRLQLTATYTV